MPSSIVMPDGSEYVFAYEPTPNNGADTTGRLSSIQLPTGATIQVAYPGPNDGMSCFSFSATLNRMNITVPDGTWSYSENPDFQVTETTPLANQSLYNFAFAEYSIGYPAERQVYAGSATGTPLETTWICYNGQSVPNCGAGSPNAGALAAEKTIIMPDGLEAVTKTDYNAHDEPTEIDQYDWGQGAQGPLLRKTLISYASLGGISTLPSQITVEDGSGAIAAQTDFGYDQTALDGTSGLPQHVAAPNASRGNLTSVKRWVSGSNWLTQTSTYFDSGEIAATTAPSGGITSFAYDGADGCAGAFPTSVSLPLNLTRTMTWDCNGGVPSSETDENGTTTSYSYDDPFWRVTGASDPDGGGATIAYISPTETETTTAITGSEGRVEYTLLDAMGQLNFTQVQDGSACDTVETTRNAMGWIVFTSRPYSSPCENPSWGSDGSSTDYDALGRPTTVCVSGGSIGGSSSYSYVGNDTAEASGSGSGGALGAQWQYNALGELTSVCAATTTLPGNGACGQTNGGTGYLTTYTRNSLAKSPKWSRMPSPAARHSTAISATTAWAA